MASQLRDLQCPVPDTRFGGRVTLAHGEGGRLMRQLIRGQILPNVGNQYLLDTGDAAVVPSCAGPIALTTDSFVVSPLFFPGGDIGSLAVYGTINDLAVAGARPLWISLAMILEEGLPVETLQRVLSSVSAAARRVGVCVVTGDTKVVPSGAVDQLFLNTTGVGEAVTPPPGPRNLAVGDELIVTGAIGRHGMAVMTSREGLQFDPPPTSDCAPLFDAVEALRRANVPVRSMRDATRGGVGAVLHEWADASEKTLAVEERLLPVTDDVRGVCELLGLDPIHVANEGTMVVAVPQDWTERALSALHSVPETSGAVAVGRVDARGLAPVVVERSTGSVVPLDEPVGAPLPRIC